MGQNSFRITAADGRVIYIDPYATVPELEGNGYDVPADILLVSHQHRDHNQVDLVTQKPGCTVITNVEALAGGTHQTFNIDGIIIEAVEANNRNHNPEQCVGFILTVDGIKIYFAADTSRTAMMETFAGRNLDYAFLPIDGQFNMGPAEAAECALLIGARVNIPIHWNQANREDFDAPGRLILDPGKEIILSKGNRQ